MKSKPVSFPSSNTASPGGRRIWVHRISSSARTYDALRPLDGPLPEGRAALYLSVEASARTAPGTYTGKLLLTDREAVPVRCQVSGVEVPAPGKGAVGVLNFFDYDNLAAQHGVEKTACSPL